MTPQTRYCPNCGAQAAPQDAFCGDAAEGSDRKPRQPRTRHHTSRPSRPPSQKSPPSLRAHPPIPLT